MYITPSHAKYLSTLCDFSQLAALLKKAEDECEDLTQQVTELLS